MLNFDRCNKSARSDCKSDAEIDEFIKDIRVDINAQYEIINFDKYLTKPTEITSSIFTSLSLAKF
jgi:hypothetical protein